MRRRRDKRPPLNKLKVYISNGVRVKEFAPMNIDMKWDKEPLKAWETESGQKVTEHLVTVAMKYSFYKCPRIIQNKR